MAKEQIDSLYNAVWIDQNPSQWDAVNSVRDLLDHIQYLENELSQYRKPVQEIVTLSMAKVDQLLVSAGWIPRGNGVSYGRGLDRMTIQYTNGVFRWAWMNSQRIENFNDLLRVKG